MDFQVGMVAYIGITVISKLGLLHDRYIVLGIAIAGTAVYVLVHSAQVWQWFVFPDSLPPAARLCAMFTIGMAIFSYRAEIFKSRFLTPTILVAALIQYFLLPWTPLIEIFAGVFWVLMAFALMRLRIFEKIQVFRSPGLAIALYIFHWPIAQLILLSLPDITSGQLIAIALPASLVFSWLLSQLVTTLTDRGTIFAQTRKRGRTA